MHHMIFVWKTVSAYINMYCVYLLKEIPATVMMVNTPGRK